jgi:nucleoside 2-deoxyribosyltransferase
LPIPPPPNDRRRKDVVAMKIVICGSRRFHDEIREAAQRLRENDHVVLEPILNRNKDINHLPADLKRYAFLGLTHHQLDLIRKADVCLIFNKDGYIGNSTTLELGYAVACGLVIYALEEDREEPCRAVLFDFVVGSIDEFVRQVAA